MAWPARQWRLGLVAASAGGSWARPRWRVRGASLSAPGEGGRREGADRPFRYLCAWGYLERLTVRGGFCWRWVRSARRPGRDHDQARRGRIFRCPGGRAGCRGAVRRPGRRGGPGGCRGWPVRGTECGGDGGLLVGGGCVHAGDRAVASGVGGHGVPGAAGHRGHLGQLLHRQLGPQPVGAGAGHHRARPGCHQPPDPRRQQHQRRNLRNRQLRRPGPFISGEVNATVQHADNTTTGFGGGIDNEHGATLTVSDSTFTGNTGTEGGAIASATETSFDSLTGSGFRLHRQLGR